jgi:hypothetical protein
MLKWNVDASVNGNLGPSRIGGVLRDHEDKFLCIFYCYTGNMNSSENEILVIKKAPLLSTYCIYAFSNQWTI